MFENSVEHCEDPSDGLEFGVARNVGLDEELDHRATSEQEVRHQVEAVPLRLR